MKQHIEKIVQRLASGVQYVVSPKMVGDSSKTYLDYYVFTVCVIVD